MVSQLPDPPMIFTHLLPQFLPELDWDELPYLSDLARAAHRESSYEALRDAIRKIQWAKFAGSEAIEFERLTENELGTLGVGALLNEPFGQLPHQKALLDFVFHAKAALDSLTVFLVERFDLALTGGDRDLRRPRCRKLIIDADEAIGAEIQRLSPWLDRSSQSVESLIAVRDDWLHRASPNVAMVQPRPDLGLFPIPKELSQPDRTRPFDPNMHLSTEEFVEFHLGRLFGLAVVPTDVVYKSSHWRPSSESRVGSAVIIGLDPLLQAIQAFLVGAIEPRVSPLLKEGADEAFGLAIGLRPVGFRDEVINSESALGLGEDA